MAAPAEASRSAALVLYTARGTHEWLISDLQQTAALHSILSLPVAIVGGYGGSVAMV